MADSALWTGEPRAITCPFIIFAQACVWYGGLVLDPGRRGSIHETESKRQPSARRVFVLSPRSWFEPGVVYSLHENIIGTQNKISEREIDFQFGSSQSTCRCELWQLVAQGTQCRRPETKESDYVSGGRRCNAISGGRGEFLDFCHDTSKPCPTSDLLSQPPTSMFPPDLP
ncbi:hypothetical protein B0F90DRAFT_386457 [Multifurca ochricompacta]|uniref:Uncharacterized protein n=1 Tax=Multifurca ochricompacta TaxID=376703 RepID=A0AAD4QJ95_9AGAM|nr:hypothetical protein B0F90DRAFT_386457 [Multifurca ochricompacta]